MKEKILTAGFSLTGIAAAKYLSTCYDVYLTEANKKNEEDADKIKELENLGVKLEFGGHTKEFVQGAKFAIISPSIPRDADIIKLLEECKVEYFSDIEYVFRITREKQKPKMIVITGTNGKTTTTLLTSHIFSQKFIAPSCGNVGKSPFEYLNANDASSVYPDYLIAEASSYQLNYSVELAPKIAIFCNLTPDHIAWHGGLEGYFEAKASMFRRMDENCHAILNFDDEKVKNLAKELKCKVHFFALRGDELNSKDKNCYIWDNSIYFGDEKIIDTNDVPIVGSHNLQNVMCAVIAAKIEGIDTSIIVNAIKDFKAPAHRCEFIRMLDGTAYYNDSKATNPEASIVAINSFEGKKTVLIAGGRDKNTSLDEFAAFVKERISKVVLIGEATQRFTDELYKNGYSNIVHAQSLEEAVDLASLDKPDIVLLSPACASFDMFKNYEQRGEAFRRYVLSKKQLVSR